MSKIETQNMDVVDKHSTGTHPIGITFDGAKKNIWVACYTGNIMIFHDGYYDEKENESAPLIASRKGNSLLGIAGRYIQPAEETPTWSLREMADIVEETKKEINVYSYNDFLDEENKLKSEEVKLKKLEEESLGAIRDGQKALEEKRADLLNKTILEAESYNNKEKSEAKDNLFDHASKSIELANQLKLMRDAKKKQLAAIKKNKEELLFSRLGEAKSKKEAFLDSKNEEYQRHKKNSIALANFLLEKEKNLEQLAIENKEKRTAFLFKKIEEATEYKKELNKKLEEEKEESVSLGKSLIEKSKIEAAEKIREENIRLEKLKDAKLKEEATKRRKEKLLKEKEERKSIDKEENKKDQFELLFEYLEDAQKQQDKIKKNTLKQIEKHTEESLAYAELVYEEQQKRKALEKLETVNSKEEDRLAALEQKIARKDLLSDIKDLQKEYNEHIKQSITYAEKLLAKIEEQEKVLGEKIIAKESKKQLAEMKSLEKVTTTSTKETKEEKEVEKPKEIKKATQKIDTKIDEGAYYAVVGSYGEKKHAIRKQKKFIKKGFDNTDIIYNKSRGLYYVFVNQFDSREATQDYADEKGIDVWIFNKK